MKISRIKIMGFGKFRDTEFSFQKGLNVVYGQNESGKTTLANFILYTLSGFTSEEVRKYTPWIRGEFDGELILETKSGELRLKLNPRDPSHNRVLRREEYEASSFIPEEGGLTLSRGVSGIVIAKLRKKMEEIERMERVIDLLKNEQNVYEELSRVERDLGEKVEDLKQKLSDLTEKLSEEKEIRKRYVDSKKRLNSLEREMENLEKRLLAARIKKAHDIWREMDTLRVKISSMGIELSNLEKFIRYPQEKIGRVWSLKKELEEIEGKASKISAELAYRREEERILKERKKVLEELLRISESEDVDKVILKVKNIELSMKMLEEKRKPKGYDERWEFFDKTVDIESRMSEILSMMERLEKLEKDLSEIERELEAIDKELATIKTRISLRNTLTIVFLALAGGLIGAGYLSNLLFFFSIAAAVSTGLSLALFLSTGELRRGRINLEGEKERLGMNYRVLGKKIDGLRNEISSRTSGSGFRSPQEMIDEYRRYQNWKKTMESRVENESMRILEREIVKGLREFFDEVKGDYSRLVEEVREKASEYAILRDKIASLKLSIDGLQTVLEDLRKKKETLLGEREALFEELECDDYEDCLSLQEKRERYEKLAAEKERLESRLKELGELWKEFRVYYDTRVPQGVDTEENLESIEILNARIENTKMEILDVKSRVEQLSKEMENARVEISEIHMIQGELERTRLHHIMAEEELRAFPEVIRLFSGIRDEFVEKYKEIFEKRFREYSEKIIGRDFETAVEDDLSVRVKISGIESLSRATKDQIELAYKLALYDVLSPDDPYPFVIDNALTRYDDSRLETTVALLKDISKNRQVILTTSDTRVLRLVPKRSVKELYNS